MTIAIILVLAAFLSLAALLSLAKERAAPTGNLSNLREQLRSLDIEAFRNLTDSREEEFLRRRLDAAQFRVVQRARQRAAVEYILCAASNASTLHRFGEAARHSPSSSVAEAGDKLVNSAIRFRIYAFRSVVGLYLAMMLPSPKIRPLLLAEGYERLTHLVVLLGCLQNEGRGATPFTVRQAA